MILQTDNILQNHIAELMTHLSQLLYCAQPEQEVYTFLNQGLYRLTGYNENYFQHAHFTDIIISDDLDRYSYAVNQALETSSSYHIDYRILKADGDIINVTDDGLVVIDPQDSTKKIMGLIREISDSQELSKQLKEYSQLKSQFLSSVSHEMRTPLCVFKNIISNATAGAYGKIPPAMKDQLQTADSTINRLSKTISNFFDCSAMEAGNMTLDLKPLDLQNLVREIISAFDTSAREKKIKIKTFFSPRPVIIIADKNKLSQAISNLIDNAIKFTPEKGTVNIFINEQTDQIEIAIQDNGTGISKEDIEKIFDPFTQPTQILQKGFCGTGLGLYITRKIIELHKGQIWVDSRANQGSCFTFVLPKKQDTAKTNPDKTSYQDNSYDW